MHEVRTSDHELAGGHHPGSWLVSERFHEILFGEPPLTGRSGRWRLVIPEEGIAKPPAGHGTSGIADLMDFLGGDGSSLQYSSSSATMSSQESSRVSKGSRTPDASVPAVRKAPC
ncbi:MAG: hypothetical protein MUC41_04650 [Syntrophobacteraceae bacterium]|nr:hypothetical protein [Syntrophobacteraceae bacterium]